MSNKVDFTKPVRFKVTGTAPVRIVAFDLPAGYLPGPSVCVVLLNDAGKEYADIFPASLFENIPPEPRVWYVNVYKDSDGCAYGGAVHRNRAFADQASEDSRVACVRVTEGQFDE